MTYKASMEMIGSCVKVEDDGTTSVVKHVLFTDTEGNEVRYPWQALKEVVIEWMKVESEELLPCGHPVTDDYAYNDPNPGATHFCVSCAKESEE